MKYLVTGADGKLAGRVANNMLEAVAGTDLIFTCPNLARVPMENSLGGKRSNCKRSQL